MSACKALRPARRHRRASRLVTMAVLTALIGLAGVGATTAGSPRAVAAAAPLARPNIVLILTDDQSVDSIQRMPYVSSRPNWIKFPNTFIENSMCCPSRSTILKGQWDTHTGVNSNGATAAFKDSETLGVWLQRAGYSTGFVGKYLNNYPQAFGHDRFDPFVPPGWSDWQVAYGLISTSPGGSVLDSLYNQYNWEFSDNGTHVHFGTAESDYQLNVLGGRARDFIDASANSGKPFFLYFAPTATHGPWVASPNRKGMFATTPVPHRPDYNEQDVSDKPDYIQHMPLTDPAKRDADRRRLWAASVSTDDQIRLLDQELKAKGVFNNTVEIFLTDNGYSFGEHRWNGKQCSYTECNITPMYVRYPGRTAATYGTALSNADLASTITAMAGTTPAIPQDGSSFLPLILGQPLNRPDGVLLHWPGTWHGDPKAIGFLPQFWAVRTQRYLYVEDTGATTGVTTELYDNKTDPFQLANVAGKPADAAIQSQLAARLADLRTAATTPVFSG